MTTGEAFFYGLLFGRILRFAVRLAGCAVCSPQLQTPGMVEKTFFGDKGPS
jgi:hypothetical protein